MRTDDAAGASSIATSGFTGSAGRLPHADQIIAAAPQHAQTIEGIQSHVGGPAADASTALGAHGYATGNQVAFAQPPDVRLAAHEAAHVIQQADGVHRSDGIGEAGDHHEQAADAFADAVATGRPAPVQHGRTTGPAAPGPAIQKKDDPAPHKPDLQIHPPDHISDAIDRFRRALDASDQAGAEQAWSTVPAQDRLAFGASSTIDRDLQQILHVLGPMIVPIMGDCHLDFTGREALIEQILAVGMPNWFDPLADYGGTLLSSFINHLPGRGRIDQPSIDKLQRLMSGTTSLALARPLFERIYTTLSDTTYNAHRVQTAAWKTEHIHRLYDVLSKYLPLAHVRTITAFYLGKDITHAWWTHDSRVVLPESRAETGGTFNHSMTGGKYAQSDKGDSKPEMAQFDVSALHEVGHGVGGKLGGHAWAEAHPFVGWRTHMNVDTWSKALWGDDATLTQRAVAKVGKDKALASAAARTYLATDVSGKTAPLPPGFASSDEVEDALENQYSDQKLFKYWQSIQGKDLDEIYHFSGQDAYGPDGNVYVWISRDQRGYSSYTQQAHIKKISWYSLSSPHEWFAEQYAHYYRNHRIGSGLDPGTKQKLDELDRVAPTNDALIDPTKDSSDDADGGGDAAGERRVPFPW